MSAVTGVSFFLRACPSKFFHSSVQYHNFFTVVSQHVFHSCGCVPCTMFFMGVFQLPCTTFSTSVPACYLRVCFMHHVFLRVSQHVFFGCHGMFFYVYVPDFQHFLCECIPALFLIIKLTSFGGKRKKFTNLPPKNC